MAIVEIWTAQDLYNVRNDLTGNYIQMADIDLSTYQPWTPIGNYDIEFKGSYDGNNYKITNLVLEPTDRKGAGLFGDIYTTYEIKNITIENAVINCIETVELSTPVYPIGTLAGLFHGGHINNCHISSTININAFNSNSFNTIGGLVGSINISDMEPTTVKKCTVNIEFNNLGTINDFDYSGLFIGQASGYRNSGLIKDGIEDCHATGNLIGGWDCGGFIGSVWDISVKKCSVVANIICEGTTTGFISWVNNSIIEDCFSKSSITCNNWFGCVSGFANTYGNTSISNCYSVCSFDNQTGDVIEDSGSFIGDYAAETLTVTSCYYNSETSSLPELFATPKTTEEMKTQSTYINWDFNNIWYISNFNEGYPAFEEAQGFDIYVITFNELTQQKELKQVESISLIAGTNEVKELKSVSEFKIITDTGLK